MLRTYLAAALVLAASACKPDLPQDPAPPVVTAVFDPTKSAIPLPNDLVFLNAANTVCPPGSPAAPAGTTAMCAQAELLTSFAGQFPSDQEVAVTIDFEQLSFDTDPLGVKTAPDLDLASFTPATFAVIASTPDGTGSVVLDPPTYAKSADGTHGTLSIHRKDHAPWAQGSYVAFVRGGPSGIKTADGSPVGPSTVFALIAQGQDMTDPKNIGLLKAQLGSTAAAIEQGGQLNLLIALYKSGAYPAVDQVFPHQELASLTTFKIGASYTNVTIDPARGLVPLPIDLLRDAKSGKLTPLAACTLAGSSIAADGNCATATATAAAAGFKALDGFSTTGAILSPTSELIQVSSITPGDSLRLYDLTNPQLPVQVSPASLIFEPCEFTSAFVNGACGSRTGALSPVIAIQPAGATGDDPSSLFRTRPLKDNTDYAVVMTTDVKDKAGKSLAPGTVAQIVRFKNPLSVGGKSMLQGIDDGTAASLEKMRLQLQPVFTALAGAPNNLPASKIAMAYTFHTQTILSTAVQLAALPYTQAPATAVPGAVTTLTPAAASTRFGSPAPNSNIDEILETDIPTFNLLDPATGAFNPDPTKAVAETIHVLIATPKASSTAVPACIGQLAPFGKCAPLMVFRHGLGRGRIDMLAIADSYAAAGMVTVAIDAAKHGDRAFCTSGTTGPAGGCNTGVACTTALPAGAQGDAAPPGQCADGKLFKRTLVGTDIAAADAAHDGIPVISGNYLVSANFFRTRDTMRQDLIDESQLIRAIAFAPTGAPPTGHTVFDHMVGRGLIIDPATIYFSGQSLGAIQGTMDVATNPRISKAAFNVGGGTITDIFNNSPAFKPTVTALLDGLGIKPGTSAFLQFLVVAKTVLDPADPINFAGHLTQNTLPNLLPPLGGNPDGSVQQAPKRVLTQIANCDGVVPNPFNLVHTANIGTGPTPAIGPGFFAPNAKGTFQLFVNTGFNPAAFGTCPNGAVNHGFLLDFSVPSLTLKAQGDIANFVTTDFTQLSVETP